MLLQRERLTALNAGRDADHQTASQFQLLFSRRPLRIKHGGHEKAGNRPFQTNCDCGQAAGLAAIAVGKTGRERTASQLRFLQRQVTRPERLMNVSGVQHEVRNGFLSQPPVPLNRKTVALTDQEGREFLARIQNIAAQDQVERSIQIRLCDEVAQDPVLKHRQRPLAMRAGQFARQPAQLSFVLRRLFPRPRLTNQVKDVLEQTDRSERSEIARGDDRVRKGSKNVWSVERHAHDLRRGRALSKNPDQRVQT